MTTRSPLSRRMAGWFTGSVNRRIFAAVLTVAGFSVVVKATATLKELAVAYRFGTGDAVDAFLIAFLVPSLVVNVVAGSLIAAFTPVYIQVRVTQGAPAARRLLGSVMLGSAILALIVTCLLIALMPFGLGLLGAAFSGEKLALTRSLFLLLLPIVLLNAVVTIWSAALNAEERFASVALAPVCVPLISLGLVLVAGRTWGIYSLALGTVFGFLAQCVVLGIALSRQGGELIPRWAGMTPELRRVVAQYVPMVAGAVLTSSSWAIGQAMATRLPAGSVASLNYGNKVVAMITEVGSMSLATAVLPHFSVMVARHEWSAIRRTLRVYVRVIVISAVPATLVLVLCSGPIVRILFERGAFTPRDTTLVAAIQALYLLQVPFVMVAMLFVRLASSLQKNQILLVAAAITLPLTIVLNLTLIRLLGVAGIALSTSLMFLALCCFLMLAVHHTLRVAERHYTDQPAEGEDGSTQER